ncbi:hypothetical protein LINPERPRIM_LOCUS10991 [Linum perenne]
MQVLLLLVDLTFVSFQFCYFFGN